MSIKTRLSILEKSLFLKTNVPDCHLVFVGMNKEIVAEYWYIPDSKLPRLNKNEYTQWNEIYKQMDKNSIEFKNWIDNLTYDS